MNYLILHAPLITALLYINFLSLTASSSFIKSKMPFININNFALGITTGMAGVGMAGVAGVQASQTATVDFADTIPVITTHTNTTLTGEGMVRPEDIGDHEISVYTDQETKDSGLSYEERHCIDGVDGPKCDSADGTGEDVWSPLFIRDVYNNTRSALNNTVGETGFASGNGVESSLMRKRHGGGDAIGATGAEVYTESNNNFDFGIYSDEDEDSVEVKLDIALNEEDEDESEIQDVDVVAKKEERSGATVGAGGEVDEAAKYPWEVSSCASEEAKKAKKIEEEIAFFHYKGTSTRHPLLVLREQRQANGNATEGDHEELLDADYYLHKETSIFDDLEYNNNLMREAFTLLIAAFSTALVLVGRRAPAKHAVY